MENLLFNLTYILIIFAMFVLVSGFCMELFFRFVDYFSNTTRDKR